MPLRIFAVLSLVLAGAGVLSAPGQAALRCSADDLIADVRAGDRAAEDGRFEDARMRWQAAADAGLAPAMRRLGTSYLKGQGVRRDQNKAAFWIAAATYWGDGLAATQADRLRQNMGEAAYGIEERKIPDWIPPSRSCWRTDDGANTVLAANRLQHKDGFEIEISKGIPAEHHDVFLRNAALLMENAKRVSPVAGVNLGIIDKVEVIPGDRYDRYIGWREGSDQNVLVITMGNFLDETQQYSALAVVLEATRRVFARFPETSFIDPFVREIEGMRVYGSVYPDIDNERFFEAITKVLKQAKGLPARIYQTIQETDEVRYAPVSRHYRKGGRIDAMVGYYKQDVSYPGNRVVFIRRNIKYGSRADLLLTLVHEGTHVLQDIEAGQMEREIGRLKRALRQLPAGDPQASEMTENLTRKQRHVDVWRKRTPRSSGSNPGIHFECAATIMEIEAAKALNIPPKRVESSQYLSVCKDARRALIRWKNSR